MTHCGACWGAPRTWRWAGPSLHLPSAELQPLDDIFFLKFWAASFPVSTIRMLSRPCLCLAPGATLILCLSPCFSQGGVSRVSGAPVLAAVARGHVHLPACGAPRNCNQWRDCSVAPMSRDRQEETPRSRPRKRAMSLSSQLQRGAQASN